MDIISSIIVVGVLVGIFVAVKAIQRSGQKRERAQALSSAPEDLRMLRDFVRDLGDFDTGRFETIRSYILEQGWDVSSETLVEEDSPAEMQTEQIRRGIDEALSGPPGNCANFGVSEASWVQIVGNMANIAYPIKDSPKEILEMLCEVAQLPVPRIVEWNPANYLMLEFETVDSTRLSRWIDLYFLIILKCGGYYSLRVTIEAL